jgi:hypothetical protein
VNEAKNNARKYSNTRGRWVTEITRESEDPDTIQFAAQSRNESSLSGAPDFDVHPPTPDGKYFEMLFFCV